MSKSIDEIIRAAMDNGEFENLPNKGKKLDLQDYFDTPEELRVGYSILKSGDFIPEEVQLLKEIEELQNTLSKLANDTEKAKIRKEIRERRLKYDLLLERFRRPHS